MTKDGNRIPKIINVSDRLMAININANSRQIYITVTLPKLF